MFWKITTMHFNGLVRVVIQPGNTSISMDIWPYAGNMHKPQWLQKASGVIK